MILLGKISVLNFAPALLMQEPELELQEPYNFCGTQPEP
jgi:hypothetical protein